MGLVVAAAPSATPSGRTQFIITGGTVTIVLAQDFLNVLVADDATLSAGGGASITRTKSHQTVLTLHVLGGMANNAMIELAPHCRCVAFTTRGALHVSGNGARMNLERPYFAFNGKTLRAYLAFDFKGATQQIAVELGRVRLPASLAGKTFSLHGLHGIVDPSSGRGLFAGYNQNPGEPGDGAAPHWPYRSVTFGTVAIDLSLKPPS